MAPFFSSGCVTQDNSHEFAPHLMSPYIEWWQTQCPVSYPYVKLRSGFSSLYSNGVSYPNDFSTRDGFEDWKYKPIDLWSPYDTLFWILSELRKLQVVNPAAVRLEFFAAKHGEELKNLSLEEFKRMIPPYGEALYYKLHKMIDPTEQVAYKTAWKRIQMSQQLRYLPEPPDLEIHTGFFPTYSTRGSSLMCYDVFRRDWAKKSVEQWTPHDTLEWIVTEMNVLEVKNQAGVRLEFFSEMNGCDLKKLTLGDFQKIIPECGTELYYQLQLKMMCDRKNSTDTQQNDSSRLEIFSQVKPLDLNTKSRSLPSVHSEFAVAEDIYTKVNELESALDQGKKSAQGKQKVSEGLAKVKKHVRLGRVWEFLRDLLLDPRYTDVIVWENRALGVFRFENSAEAAKLWGEKRGNPHMNFKKFSRAMRYNYRMGYLLPVENKRLVYRFGKKATGLGSR